VRFAVRLLRYSGRILPLREIASRPALVGDLRIEECRDEELKRSLRTALLCVLPSEDRPRLLDVHTIGMSPQAFTRSGFERVEGVECMQSWIVARCD